MLSEELRQFAAEEAEKIGLRQLARNTGIHAGNLCKLISGERPPSGSQYDILANELGLALVRKKPAKRTK